MVRAETGGRLEEEHEYLANDPFRMGGRAAHRARPPCRSLIERVGAGSLVENDLVCGVRRRVRLARHLARRRYRRPEVAG